MSKLALIASLVSFLATALSGQEASFSSFHIGSYESPLGSRVTSDGVIDSGDGLFELFDATSGEALVAREMQYMRGPKLVLTWKAAVGEGDMGVRMVSIPTTAGGDTRLLTALLLSFENRGEESRSVPVGLRMRAGGPASAEAPRPIPHAPYDADARYAVVGDELLRDDRVLMRWVGNEPTVTVTDAPSGPDDVVCELGWGDLVVPPRTLLSLSIFIAGPPASSTVNESRWRRLFESNTYVTAEERAIWETRVPSSLFRVKVGEKRLFRSLRAAIFMVNMLGEYDDLLHEVRARPYNLPGTTLAERAEAIVPYIEWSMPQAASARLSALVGEAEETLADLPASERVAVLAALSSCTRLMGSTGLGARVGALVRDHLGVDGLDGTPVRPWQDPEAVAARCRQALDDAGIDEVELPELAWADVEPGTAAAVFQDLRRAISARDLGATLEQLGRLDPLLDANTIGRMDPSGEPDITFGLALLSCVRDMLIDDHGEELVLCPALPGELMADVNLDSSSIPTRYGVVRMRGWWSTKKMNRANIDLRHVSMRSPAAVVWRLPADRDVSSVRIPGEGSYELRGEHEFVVLSQGTDYQAEVRFDD